MTMRNHLLATEHIVVRGLVSPLACRLGDHLRTSQRPYLAVVDAEVRTLLTDQVTTVDLVRIGIDAVVWAHEFVALTGDDFRRRTRESAEEHPLVITMDRPEGLVIAGWQADSTASQDPLFFVVKRPRAEGSTPLAAKHAEMMSALPYILVNQNAPAVIVPG